MERTVVQLRNDEANLADSLFAQCLPQRLGGFTQQVTGGSREIKIPGLGQLYEFLRLSEIRC
jgi:hypothetical protein